VTQQKLEKEYEILLYSFSVFEFKYSQERTSGGGEKLEISIDKPFLLFVVYLLSIISNMSTLLNKCTSCSSF